MFSHDRPDPIHVQKVNADRYGPPQTLNQLGRWNRTMISTMAVMGIGMKVSTNGQYDQINQNLGF